MKKITINLDVIKEIVNKGVRRAAVFMGLGLNAAYNKDFNDYQLTNLANIQIIPSDVDENTIKEYKNEFRLWIIQCGLRELVETFLVFLDKLFEACLLVKAKENGMLQEEFRKKIKDFNNKGVKGKLEALSIEFCLDSIFLECIASINQARHCLAHRRGIVGREDCFGGNELIIKWRSFEFYINKHSGEELVLGFPIPKDGILVDKNETISFRLTDKQLEFKVGEVIKLNSQQLAEICHFFLQISQEIINSAINYIKAMGVEFENTKSQE